MDDNAKIARPLLLQRGEWILKNLFQLFLYATLLLALAGAAQASDSRMDAPEAQRAELIMERHRIWDARRAQQEALLTESLNPDSKTDEDATLSDASGTVVVTVNLPSGVTAPEEASIGVYLYTPAKVNTNGLVVEEPASVRGKYETFQNGRTSTTVTITDVPEGSYILYTSAYHVNSPEISGLDQYYSGDGTLASSAYTAVPFTISAGRTVSKTITLRRAERSIRGEVYFSKPLVQDTTISFYASDYDNGRDEWYDKSLYIPAGKTSAEFAFGVGTGSYELELSGSGTYRYYGIEGSLTSDYNQFCYLNTWEESVNGLRINGDSLLEEGKTTETVQVAVEIKLPETLTEAKRYAIFWSRNQNNSSIRTVNVSAGQATISATLTLNRNTEYVIGYYDVSGASSYYGYRNTPDVCFAAADGITTVYEKAQKFTFSENSSLTIQYPAFYKLTGTLNRNGYNTELLCAAYAVAKFSDGEQFAARVILKSGMESAPYTIYVPQTYNGENLDLYASVARGMYNQINSASESAPIPCTLNGNTNAGTISVSDAYITVSGRVSLPEGISLPTGGQAVELQMNYESGSVFYVIPSGTRTLPFAFHSYPRTDYSSQTEATLVGEISSIYPQIRQSYSREPDYSDIALDFPKSAVISGQISLPDGINDVGVTVEISASGGNLYPTSRASIAKGNFQTGYSLTVPVGQLRSMSVRPEISTEDRVQKDDIYVQSDWTTGSYYGNGLTVEENRSGVNFVLAVWPKEDSDYLLESLHGFTGPRTLTYTYIWPGECESLTLHFTERSDTELLINGESYDWPAGEYITVTGNSVTVTVTNEYEWESIYGFAVDEIIPEDMGDTAIGAAAVYTANGSDVSTILDDIRDGRRLTAVFVGNESEMPKTAFAALYSSDGKFLGLTSIEETALSFSGTALHFQFEANTSEASCLKIFLANSDFSPAMEALYFQS